MSDQDILGFETRAIHAGSEPDPSTGARDVPIHFSTAFVFKDADHAARLFNLEEVGFIYSRLTNPTVSTLEARVADLEGGVAGTATASGHAAQLMALFPLMGPGLEFIASNRLYGGSITQFSRAFERFGWKVHFVDMDKPDNIRAVINENTRAVFAESLANPGGVVSDLSAIAAIAHEHHLPFIVDNTLATPYLCRPFEHGADIVVHSTTKFISGHGNAMGGIVIDSGKFDWSASDKYPSLSQPEPAYHGLKFQETFGALAYTIHLHAVGLRDLGATAAPMNAYLTLTGVETLPLRMERHCENAQKVAEYLQGHDKVAWVSYAGLADNPYNGLAKKYIKDGAGGGVFTFGIKGGYKAGKKFVESVKLFSHLANLGDIRSLIIHPSSTTHRQLAEEQQIQAGAGPDVIRLSIGIETIDDLLADLAQAFEAV